MFFSFHLFLTTSLYIFQNFNSVLEFFIACFYINQIFQNNDIYQIEKAKKTIHYCWLLSGLYYFYLNCHKYTYTILFLYFTIKHNMPMISGSVNTSRISILLSQNVIFNSNNNLIYVYYLSMYTKWIALFAFKILQNIYKHYFFYYIIRLSITCPRLVKVRDAVVDVVLIEINAAAWLVNYFKNLILRKS